MLKEEEIAKYIKLRLSKKEIEVDIKLLRNEK